MREAAMKWYFTVLKKYAVFAGRSRRKEYWMFQLFSCLIIAVLLTIDALTGMKRDAGLGLLSSLYVFGVLIPSLAVLVRRLHDTDRSGWWVFIGLIPLLGPIILLIFAVQDSQPGENRFGPNPKTTLSGSTASGTALQAG
jgi:uncharacterized membrane protein YhaH (DUF805 family)